MILRDFITVVVGSSITHKGEIVRIFNRFLLPFPAVCGIIAGMDWLKKHKVLLVKVLLSLLSVVVLAGLISAANDSAKHLADLKASSFDLATLEQKYSFHLAAFIISILVVVAFNTLIWLYHPKTLTSVEFEEKQQARRKKKKNRLIA